MKFLQLAQLYQTLEKTNSYNTMRDILAKFLKNIPKKELKTAAYFTLGRIAPEYTDVNLGIAEKMAMRSIAKSANKPTEIIDAEYKKNGDVGETAQRFLGKGSGLEMKEAFETLHQIAKTSGNESQEQKIELLRKLLRKTTPLEAKYLMRIVLGQLRLGVGDKTVLDGLALAYADKKARSELEHAYNICPDIGIIAETISTKGMRGIKNIKVIVGIPIQMMLCQRIEDLEELNERTGFPVAIETKYDGERIQAHKKGKTVTLYSRRLENITHQFPELVSEIRNLNARDCIIEGEAVAVNKKGELLPFQIMMQRRRKYDIKDYVTKVPISLKTFDCIYLNGKSLLKQPYPKRYESLKKIVKRTKLITHAEQIICDNTSCADDFFQKIVVEGGEGIVIKSLKHDSTYQAGTRGWHWIKWKPEYVKGMRDTFDLVVVGAYAGKGRRSGTYGALLCAVYDQNKGKFLTFCKLGTGLNDKTLRELPTKLRKKSSKPLQLEIDKTMTPDTWIEPDTMVEVAGAEITKSPNHTAGYALRFPRFLRFREKKAEQATSIDEIKSLVKKKTRTK